MSITDLIANDLTAALRVKDAARASALRMAKAALQRAEIAKRPAPFTDEDAVRALRGEVKKRAEAADLYRQGNRPELAAKEEAETRVLTVYLPAEADAATVRAAVAAAIAKLGATSLKDMGKVIGLVMKQLGSSVSGDQVSAVVREMLGGSGT